jgi:aminomethyltransferase
MTEDLRAGPLASAHEGAGAEFTGFGGWNMPVEFDGIRTEHEAVREAVGKFDVSHMGEVHVSGPDAAELLSRLTTRDVSATEPGQVRYGAITDEDGVMLDDTVVTNLPREAPRASDGSSGRRPRDEAGPAEFLFVPNAGHDAEMYDRWVAHRDEWGLDAEVENATDEYAMVAVQGPDAPALTADVVGEAVADLGRFRATDAEVGGVPVLVSRTGYTGEDGFELVVPAEEATTVWEAFDCQPCGLGARDTLRIEAGLLLSGRDFHPAEQPRTPLEAGIDFAVELDHEFVGAGPLRRQDEEGVDARFVGVALEERGVPRHGYPIETLDGEDVGVVTSGTMSPTLDEPIGLGYVDVGHDDPGTEVRVVIRGRERRARIETPRFVE